MEHAMRFLTRRFRLFAIVPGALAASCARSPFGDGLLAQMERDLGPSAPNERRIAERSMRLGEVGAVADATPPAEAAILEGAGVEDLAALALQRNPAIFAAEQRVRRLRERIAQATSLDDPNFNVVPIGEMAETAAGQVGLMASLSQRIPFPGKLTARGEAAAAEVAAAEQDLERARLRVAADVRRTHARLYDAVRSIEITRSSAALLEQAIEAVRAQRRAGRATQDAVLRASVERQRLEKDLLELAQRRQSAVAMLNALLDRPPDAPISDPAAIELPEFDESLDALLAEARGRNPQVQAALKRLTKFQAQRALAGLQRAPDVTLSASFNAVREEGLSRVATGDDQWWFGFSFNLPIWLERLSAAEREATRGAIESAGEAADAARRVEFAVVDAHARARSLHDQAALLRDVIAPQARLAVDSSLAAYRSGGVDFLTVIDNWRTLLSVQLMYERSVAEMQRALADLREAVAEAPALPNASAERNDHD